MSGKTKLVVLLGIVAVLYVVLSSGEDPVEVEVETDE